MKDLVVIEPQCIGNEHVPFNSAFLGKIITHSPKRKIDYFSEQTHHENVKNFLVKNGIDTSNITFHTMRNKKEMVLVFFLNMFRKNRLFLSISLDRESLLISYFFAYLFRVQQIIVPHAILGRINRETQSSWIRSLLSFKRWFSILRSNKIKYCLLGPSIQRELIKFLPHLEKRCFWIHHPYFYQDDVADQPGSSDKLNFGFLGVANFIKGADLFFQLAESIKNSFKHNLFLIGTIVSDQIRKMPRGNIKVLFEKGMGSRKDFEENIAKMDYLLFFLKGEEYRLRASGSFFDALQFEKPIITLKNPYIEHYFNEFGPMGHVVDSLEEMKEKICSLDKNDSQYQEFVQNIRNCKNALAISQLEENFKEIIN